MQPVLTIAGSDSGGGAGIQADLKTFAARGVYGMSAITALTAQNTLGVQGVFAVPAEFVASQIDAVMEDIGAHAWKTGMLANAAIIHTVAERARHYQVKQLVIDPVMVAKGGDVLLEPAAQQAIINDLLPLASVVTPNHHEAGVLTGQPVTTIDEMRQAALALHAMGARAVLIKGGHLPDTSDAIDVLYVDGAWTTFRAPRVNTKNTHGTGCTFASAIAAELAKGHELVQAIENAKAYLNAAVQGADALGIGHGHGPLDHFARCCSDEAMKR
ncbi:MAG: bifunctional hydroxymethylpyrimidine kinase/phosphomethylpyrimidine kinase [Chloroflexaceae bacterium]|nr:bifunctional hydroxymethylpyrimidine kinase/phosphomethylpyrimidine kinase [Chloroflexaceae bacterium]